MIVGNSTRPIVILMELHGKAYHFTEMEKKKQWVGRCLNERVKLLHSSQFVLITFREKEMREQGD